MLDRFMDRDPKTTEIEAIILALDWVLHRVATGDIVEELTVDPYKSRGSEVF